MQVMQSKSRQNAAALEAQLHLQSWCCSTSVLITLRIATLLAELSVAARTRMVLPDRNNLTDRVETARAGGRGFYEVDSSGSKCKLVTQILQRFRATETRVMVMNDNLIHKC